MSSSTKGPGGGTGGLLPGQDARSGEGGVLQAPPLLHPNLCRWKRRSRGGAGGCWAPSTPTIVSLSSSELDPKSQPGAQRIRGGGGRARFAAPPAASPVPPPSEIAPPASRRICGVRLHFSSLPTKHPRRSRAGGDSPDTAAAPPALPQAPEAPPGKAKCVPGAFQSNKSVPKSQEEPRDPPGAEISLQPLLPPLGLQERSRRGNLLFFFFGGGPRRGLTSDPPPAPRTHPGSAARVLLTPPVQPFRAKAA